MTALRGKSKRRMLAGLAGLFLLGAAGAGIYGWGGDGASAGKSAGRGEDKSIWPVTLVTPDGAEHVYHLELAATAEARSRGLMFRQTLPEAGGMLFVWPEARVRNFWMKNTPLPLDILFFSDHFRLVSVTADTIPFSERRLSSGKAARYVVELNAGQARAKGFGTGSVLRMSDELQRWLARQHK